MTPSTQEMDKSQESAYRDAKLDATFLSYKRGGATILRYKPGTLIKNSTGDTYQVQANGSWRKQKVDASWLGGKA